MALSLMYITNNIEIAEIAQNASVDRIWVDMEYIGKDERQAGLDTVKSYHTVDDIKKLRPYIKSSELMVRVNPIHCATEMYSDTKTEIDECISAGADVLMLPMFKTDEEVKYFIQCVNGRAKTMLLFETAEAVEAADEILSVHGIDEVHIGLNDLHLAYKQKFMFELICGDVVKNLCIKFKNSGVKYGFGGIARVGFGMLPAEFIIAEHYHLGSTAAILSRGFCDANRAEDPKTIEKMFIDGVMNIRKKEKEVSQFSEKQFAENLEEIRKRVERIISSK